MITSALSITLRSCSGTVVWMFNDADSDSTTVTYYYSEYFPFRLLRHFTVNLIQVEQRRKEALSRTSEDGSTIENSLQDVVSRYSFMDLWPCSSKELDHLVRQEVPNHAKFLIGLCSPSYTLIHLYYLYLLMPFILLCMFSIFMLSFLSKKGGWLSWEFFFKSWARSTRNKTEESGSRVHRANYLNCCYFYYYIYTWKIIVSCSLV